MLLHLLSDNKFANYPIRQFDSSLGTVNEFVVLVPDRHKPLQNVGDNKSIKVIKYNSVDFYLLCKSLSKYSAIIIHNFHHECHVEIIESAAGKTNIVWVFWGFEYYRRKKTQTKFLGPRTFCLYMRNVIPKRLRNFVGIIKHRSFEPDRYEVPKKIFKKIDYCLTHIYEDFQIAKQQLPGDYKFLWYSYYSIEDTIGELIDSKVNGNNILVGNSAFYSNNHLEAFQKLSKLDVRERNIVVPLSYGNTWYANRILNRGREIFKEDFDPLMSFLELEEYNRKLQSCSIVIMNHHRQQALGNLITSLWLGSKVYISKKSSTYDYFNRIGINFYTVEDDLIPDNQQALKPLKKKLVTQNREILFREYSKKKLDESILNIVRELNV